MNERIHNAAASDGMRTIVPILVLALGALNGWIAWTVHENATDIAQTVSLLTATRLSDATYHERIDALQGAQTLQAKLLQQVRMDVQRHEYQIRALNQSAKR